MDAKKLEALLTFFEAIDRRRIYDGVRTKKTDVGLFVPSDLRVISPGIEKLVADGVIDTSRWIADTGGGDGRFVEYTSRIFGVPSVYIEYDPELMQNAWDNDQDLRVLGFPNGAQIRMARGDFTEDTPYLLLGLRFGDIATFYNFQNNHRAIAAKISRQSPRGTVFILYSYNKAVAYELENRFSLILKQSIPIPVDGYLRFLHVFRKI